MMKNIKGFLSNFAIQQVLVIIMLSAPAIATVANVVLSNPSTTSVVSPAGLTLGIGPYYTVQAPNYLGNGAQWLCINGNQSPPSNFQAYIQNNFYSFCTANTAQLKVRVDDIFQAYLNNNQVLSGAQWDGLFSGTVSMICGKNELRMLIKNNNNYLEAIFSISQQQSGCNNCCTDNMPNCLTCESSTYCNSCQSPTLMSPDHSACRYCSDYMSDCATCTSITYCTSCSPASLSLAADHSACINCALHMSNCATCTSITYCTSCSPASLSLAADNSACIDCSIHMTNCASCSSIIYCISCISSSFLLATDHSACLNCNVFMPSCATCTSTTFCLSCDSALLSLAADNSACLNCTVYMSSCATCTSTTFCLSCDSALLSLAADHSACLNCTVYMSSCATCTSTTFCLSCDSALLSLAADHSACINCSLYMSYCLTCSSITLCLTCQNLTVLSVNSSFCDVCYYFMPYCLTCSSSVYCLSCNISSLSLAADHSACINCSQYMPYCTTCTSTTYCTSCLSTILFLPANHSQCLFCIDYIAHCSTCLSQTYCTGCSSPLFFVTVDHTACHKCADAMKNCTYCLSQTFCTLCSDISLFVAANHSQCLICDQYVVNCLICISQTNCSLCKNSTFFLTSNQSFCLPCNSSLSNCLQCLNSAVCVLCNNQTVLALGNKCKHCGEIFTYCTNCTSAYQCLECEPFTLISESKQNCVLCTQIMEFCHYCSESNNCTQCFIGQIVNGGCSNVVGCIKVQQVKSLSSLEARCIECDNTSFALDNLANICQCKEGSLIGHYCFDDPGCVSTTIIDGAVGCINCNFAKRFVLNSNTHHCQCASGFLLQQNICKEICGDGKIFTSQCDDGNLDDGDGCSSICKIESNYNCTYNGTGPSVCALVSIKINIDLISIKKRGINQAVLTFDFFSTYPRLKKFNISDYFSFTCQSAVSSVEWALTNGKVTATITYSQNLQGKMGRANFTFNQLNIPHEPIIMDFMMHSDPPLLYQQETITISILNYFYFGISLSAVIILFFGSWTHKMVGVELIHPLQIIYFLQFAFKQYTLEVAALRNLSFVGLAATNILWDSGKLNVALHQNYQQFDYKLIYSEGSLVILTLPAVLSTICLLIHFLSAKYASDHVKSRIFSIMQKCYQGIVFPATLGFIFPYFLIIFTLSTPSTSSDQLMPIVLLSLVNLGIMSFTSVVLENQFRHLMTQQAPSQALIFFSLAEKHYIPVYQLYAILQLIILWIWIRQGLSLCIFVLLGTTVLMLIYLITIRPYRSILDKVSVCFNPSLLLVFFVFFFLREKKAYEATSQLDSVIWLTFSGLCVLCVSLSFVRIFRTLFCSISQSKEEEQSFKKIKQKIKFQEEGVCANLKKMTQAYAGIIPSHKQNLLSKKDKQKATQMFYKYQNDRKWDPQLMSIIQKKLKKRRQKKELRQCLEKRK